METNSIMHLFRMLQHAIHFFPTAMTHERQEKNNVNLFPIWLPCSIEKSGAAYDCLSNHVSATGLLKKKVDIKLSGSIPSMIKLQRPSFGFVHH